jgi:hypothetical protein
MPFRRRAPVKVVVFQCPCGTAARHRWPRKARPRSRAILVEAPSITVGARPSMKMRRSGSRSGWASNQALRRAATSGRSCSLACAVFFEGHRVTVEKTPHGAGREGCAMLRAKHLGQFDKSNVLLHLDRGQDHIVKGFDVMRARVTALGLGADRACRIARVDPANGARRRDAKSLGCSTAGHAAGNSSDQSGTKVDGKRLAHARWPPAQHGR